MVDCMMWEHTNMLAHIGDQKHEGAATKAALDKLHCKQMVQILLIIHHQGVNMLLDIFIIEGDRTLLRHYFGGSALIKHACSLTRCKQGRQE